MGGRYGANKPKWSFLVSSCGVGFRRHFWTFLWGVDLLNASQSVTLRWLNWKQPSHFLATSLWILRITKKRSICQKIWAEGRVYKKPENNDELAVTGARNIWFVEEKYERSNMCSRGLNPCNLCNSRTDCTVQSRRQGQTEGLVQQSHDWRWKSRFNSYESVVDWEKGVFHGETVQVWKSA